MQIRSIIPHDKNLLDSPFRKCNNIIHHRSRGRIVILSATVQHNSRVDLLRDHDQGKLGEGEASMDVNLVQSLLRKITPNFKIL